MDYPLYDIPYLVREPNDSYMSQTRHKVEAENQTIVDQYFIERDKGASATKAKKLVAQMNAISTRRVKHCLRWFYQEAVRRGKYSFLQKFPSSEEHIVRFWCIFALDFEIILCLTRYPVGISSVYHNLNLNYGKVSTDRHGEALSGQNLPAFWYVLPEA